jgi:Anti-sigma-K factor rskA
MTDEDRIAYLAGDDSPVPLEDRAELDELRALLEDPSLWADPPAELEDRVVSAIAAEPAVTPQRVASPASTRRPLKWRVVGMAAALLIAVGIAVTFVRSRDEGEHFSLALAAPSGITSGDGKVDFLRTNSGWRVKLNAPDLPRLDNGRFYEAWMKNDAGTLVPIGTFNEGKNVVLWSGVSPHDFTTLTVTQEEADGNQASSGKRVLVGTLSFGG